MTEPLVSVVMPVHNRSGMLTEAVRSVLDQTHRDLELIVADDGSTDDTATVVAGLSQADARVVHLPLERGGITSALNAGCAAARGRYIARMDSDDVCMPRRLELQVELLERDPRLGVVGGQMRCVGLTTTTSWQAVYPCTDADIRRSLPRMNPFAHPAATFRRAAFEDAGGYRTACLHAEDYDLWVRMLASWKGANVAEDVLVYRVHPGQTVFREWRQHCLSTLAVRAAAQRPAANEDDPLAGADPVTEEMLAELGVDAGALHEEFVGSLLSLSHVAALIGAPDLREALLRDAVELGRTAPLSPRTKARTSLQQALFALERRRPLAAAGHVVRAVRADARTVAGSASWRCRQAYIRLRTLLAPARARVRAWTTTR